MQLKVDRSGTRGWLPGLLTRAAWIRLALSAAGLSLLGLAFAQPPIKPKRKITLSTQSVPLSQSEPTLNQAGALRFLGGLWLKSQDEGFGGLSGLLVESGESGPQLIAITDQGDKFSGRLVIKGSRLLGLEETALEPLLDPDGRPVAGKTLGDAESITRLRSGRVLVGFERRHRIWEYGPGLTGPSTVFPTPASLADAPLNGGLESIANWPDGRILAITERLETEDGDFAAFLFQDGKWTTLGWKGSAAGFEPSDAVALPDGDLLVLERLWSALAPTSLRSRIMRVKGDSVRPGATLQGELVAELKAPLIADNFEGIATLPGENGGTQLLLVSDDNFNSVQRTLLLLFEMRQ